eukprot:974108-Pleurochrysis_carterae.AAC.3
MQKAVHLHRYLHLHSDRHGPVAIASRSKHHWLAAVASDAPMQLAPTTTTRAHRAASSVAATPIAASPRSGCVSPANN